MFLSYAFQANTSSFWDGFQKNFSYVCIVIHLHKRKIRVVDCFIIPTGSVVIPTVNHIPVGIAIFSTVSIKSIVFVVGCRSKVERGTTTDKYVKIRECIAHFFVNGAAPAAVGIEGKLIRKIGSCSEKGISDASGCMKFYTFSAENREAFLFPQDSYSRGYTFPVTG